VDTRAPTSDLGRAGLTIAGRYRLEGLLGRGGMGSVWEATHLGLGSEVAIKLVSRELVGSAEALRRFDAEAKAVAKLQSRHVVQIFDNGTLDDGTPYIAMELLRGQSLHARVHRDGPLPLHEAVSVLAQCCKALGRAHAAGIVHRDVKPDNVFLALSADDDGYVVKVLDFGIAKVASSDESVHSSTRTGAVLGTPLYMSPEQARGLRSVDHRTDIYSLGLVGFTILTGNLAFSSESFGDLLLKICTQPLPSLCASARWLPPSMEAWFQFVCAREPSQRCPTAEQFIASLRAASGISMPSDPAARSSSVAVPLERATDLSMQSPGPRRSSSRGRRVGLLLAALALASFVATFAVVGREKTSSLSATPIEWKIAAAPVPDPSSSAAADPVDAAAPRAADAGRGRPPLSPSPSGRPSAVAPLTPRDEINLGY
jgi:serine/threonine protein kinase